MDGKKVFGDGEMNIIGRLKDVFRLLTGEIPTKTLIKRGLKVGINFNRQQGCFIDPTHCFLIEIGNNVTFSIRVTLMAHDASTKKVIGYTKIGKIVIEDNVFIGANATILPNVTIGKNSIIGANSVVTKNIPENVVVAGNPAKIICSIDEYQDKYSITNKSKVFDKSYRYTKNIELKKIEELKKAVEDGIAFID